MKRNKTLLLAFIACCIPITSYAKVRVYLSAALTDDHHEFRKEQYIKSFNILAEYGYGYDDIYVVESLKKQGPTFLENYSKHVFYSTVNNPSAKDNGVNEANTMLEGSYYFDFDPEDMIIKLTGRHHFISDDFLRLVENNTDYDAIVKILPHAPIMHCICFAMKCKHFQEMFKTMDYNPRSWVNLETATRKYIDRKVKQGNFKVLFIDKLGIKAVLFGSSTAPGSTGERIF